MASRGEADEYLQPHAAVTLTHRPPPPPVPRNGHGSASPPRAGGRRGLQVRWGRGCAGPRGLAEGLTSLSILSKSSLHRVYSGMVSDMLGCRFLLEGPGCSPSGASGTSSPNSCGWCGSTALKGIF